MSIRNVVFAGALAVAACALLLASFVPSSVSAPGAGTISPLAMMAQTPRDLPIEHHDAH
jgi:hypothetical protein